MDGMIFDIQRFSIHDGPGIRTTVFVKGCSLNCFWCHNPESIHKKQELQLFQSKCIGCGDCIKACPPKAHIVINNNKTYQREKCISCGKCADGCFSGALVMSGKIVSAEDVVAEIIRDKSFYDESGGGVTISGGEPLLQKEFVIEILKLCKANGIHTAIETAANCRWNDISDVLQYTDMVMTDIKHMNPDKHKWATGVSNERILANAEKIAEYGIDTLFRTPVIPTVNDTNEEISAIAFFVRDLMSKYQNSSIQLELLKFHQLAGDKYKSLGIDYKAGLLNPLSKERMLELQNIADNIINQ